MTWLRSGQTGSRQGARQRAGSRSGLSIRSCSWSLPRQHIVRPKITRLDAAGLLTLPRSSQSRRSRTATTGGDWKNARRSRHLALTDKVRPARGRWRQGRRERGTSYRRAARSGTRSSRPELTAGSSGPNNALRRTPVDDGVDDIRIVDVREQETVHRRPHIDRRPDEDRDRNEDRLRQIVDIVVVIWRIEHDEIRRRRRQEEHRHRRRRRKGEHRIVEHQVGTIDVFVFVFRRRRHIVSVFVERRGRLKRCGDIGKPTARVRGVRPLRIALQIGPISLLRVRAIGLPPRDGFAARGDDRPHPLRHRIVRIGGKESLVVGNRVAFERGGVGILRAEIANGLRARSGILVGLQRRGIRRAVEEHKVPFKLLCVPWHLRSFGHVVDAQLGAVENFRKRNAAGADHFRKRLRVRTVVAGRIRRDCSGRGVERNQAFRLWLDQRKTARKRLALLCERMIVRSIDHDNVGLQRQR